MFSEDAPNMLCSWREIPQIVNSLNRIVDDKIPQILDICLTAEKEIPIISAICLNVRNETQ